MQLYPIAPETRLDIMDCLVQIECRHDVTVLFACESGSRGWGFASPDSDYDVRFLYVHRLPWYLTVLSGRDVIEMPISGALDINGWELRKALGLLRKGNATLMEWLDSPIVYRRDECFMAQMQAVAQICYQPERSFQHYIHMARKNYRDYLQHERVRLKKYLYVLRPVLAALWIERDLGAVPMPFHTLVDVIVTDPLLVSAIARLLEIKRAASESEYGEAIPEISRFIDTELTRLETVSIPCQPEPDFTRLDRLLSEMVQRYG